MIFLKQFSKKLVLPMVHRGSFTLFSSFPHRQFQLDVDETVLERCLQYLSNLGYSLASDKKIMILHHLIMMSMRKSLETS